jgi:hypothetical protein
MKILPAVLAITALLTSCADDSTISPAPTTRLPFEEPFKDSTALSGFHPTDLPWKVINGAISLRVATSQAYLVRKDVSFADGWVEAEVDSIDDGGIAMRVVDSRNMVLLTLHDNSGPHKNRLESRLEIWVVKNGVYRSIDSSALDWPRGTKVTARLRMVGDTVEAWADGVRLCRKIDSTVRTPGSIAIRHHGNTNDPSHTGGFMSRYLALRWLPD